MSARESFDRLTAQLKLLAVLGYVRIGSEVFENTVMPRGAQATWDQISGVLAEESHRAFTSDGIGEALEEMDRVGFDGLSIHEERLVRRLQLSWKRARALPAKLVGDEAAIISRAQAARKEAREKNDWQLLAPHFAAILDCVRERAVCLGGELDDSDSLYDAILPSFDVGLTVNELRETYGELKGWLIPFLERYWREGRPMLTDSLHREVSLTRQRQLVEGLAAAVGFDFSSGLLASVDHPFMETLAPGAVVISTWYDPKNPAKAIYGLLHEAGHGMFEQGRDPALLSFTMPDRNKLFCGSHSNHEAQSRLVEVFLGRSLPFIKYLVKTVPEFSGCNPMELYRAANAIVPTPIRVDACEIMYPLHIIMRTELEQELLSGRLSVKDLPEAWGAKMREYLGIEPPTDAEGVMKDPHWYGGWFGGFNSYARGMLIAAQLMATYRAACPDWEAEWEGGDFGSLRAWLAEKVYPFGLVCTTNELLADATGGPMIAGYWRDHIEEKFDALCFAKQSV
ncbi:MAG: hypothetical protein V1907_02690 [Candidatus Kerfeldbacteria bacterium]